MAVVKGNIKININNKIVRYVNSKIVSVMPFEPKKT